MRCYKTGELHASIKELKTLVKSLEDDMNKTNDTWKKDGGEKNLINENTSLIAARIWSDCNLALFHDDTWHLDLRHNKGYIKGDTDEEWSDNYDKEVTKHCRRLKKTIKFYEK